MSKLKYSSKNFSSEKISKYSLEYGVNIRQEEGNLIFSGSSRDIDRVKGIIQRDSFLLENRKNNNNYKSQPSSLSSQLESINLEKDYNRINNTGSSRGKNYSSSINFSI